MASHKRLSPSHRRLLQLAFDRFKAQAAWPQVARLQHELARQGDPFAVREVAKDLDPSLGHVDRLATGAEVTLTIKGVRRCVGAEQELDDFVRVVAYFVRRYLDAPDLPADVSSSELQRDLDLSDAGTRKLRLLLGSSNIPTAGGGGADAGWKLLIDDQILLFRGAKTIDQVIRRAYPAGRRHRSATRTQSPAASTDDAAASWAPGIVDWPAPAPGWGSVEVRLSNMHSRLADASTKDDWQDIGRRCREIVIEAANVVFTPRLVSAGNRPPGKNDAKARLDAYFEGRLPELADDMRAFVAGTWRLANAMTHHPRMGRLEAVCAVQGTILLVRVLQELERTPRRRHRS
ncbi:MAG: hypothetical protein C0498_12850 [Anaerolinea sp.]|nr:hypothetical protein [Anaerolinea sp.]